MIVASRTCEPFVSLPNIHVLITEVTLQGRYTSSTLSLGTRYIGSSSKSPRPCRELQPIQKGSVTCNVTIIDTKVVEGYLTPLHARIRPASFGIGSYSTLTTRFEHRRTSILFRIVGREGDIPIKRRLAMLDEHSA